MVYVITGATSFIGIELINSLIVGNNKVFAVCRPNSGGISSLPQGVEVVIAEMSEYKDLYDKIHFADVFINLAWGGTGHDGRDVVEIQEDNVKYTIDAFNSANKMKCRIFVEAGSQAEYGSTIKAQTEDDECFPFSEYGKAKLKVKEELFKLSEIHDIKYIHLRLFSIYGENDHPWTLFSTCVNKMLNNEDVALSNCTQNWNFLYVKDAVLLINKLCNRCLMDDNFHYDVYNIASNDTRVLKDYVEEIKKYLGSNSFLKYGAISGTNIVSLQPSIDKILHAIGDFSFTPFSNVIRKYND